MHGASHLYTLLPQLPRGHPASVTPSEQTADGLPSPRYSRFVPPLYLPTLSPPLRIEEEFINEARRETVGFFEDL